MQQHLSRYLTAPDSYRLFINVQHPDTPAMGTAIVLHGLAGSMDQDFLIAVRNEFLNQGFIVIAIDARFGFGHGSGPLEKACFSTFLADLTQVVDWAKEHTVFPKPFYMCGHSLGGGACVKYALDHPDDIAGIVTLSGIFNGNDLIRSYQTHKPDFMAQWKSDGVLLRTHPTHPEKSGYISYSHLADASRYQLDQQANQLTHPILMICGDRDISSTKEMNMKLFNAVAGRKELACINGANHTYTNDGNIQEVTTLLRNWLKQLKLT